MKRITKNNILKLIDLKLQYKEKPEESLLQEINIFIDEVINKDKRFYSKIQKFNLSEEQLEILFN